MSPIRHEDDFRRREIDDWDAYAHEQIEEMAERGELDNLPDRGRPIHIWRTEVNPHQDFAFSRLKNAGYKPVWMELDERIAVLATSLEQWLDQASAEIDELVEQMKVPDRVHTPPEPRGWRRFFRWLSLDTGAERERPAITVTDVIGERERLRRRFLEQTTALDKKIVDFHAALPRDLSHLQRIRWMPERAERVFDERVPLARILEGEVRDAHREHVP